MSKLYRINAPKMKGAPCFGIMETNGVVSEAAPYAHWAVGIPIKRVLEWFQLRGATIEEIAFRGETDESYRLLLGQAR